MSTERPLEPEGEDIAWYRGWEASYEWQLEFYTGEGFRAYKGGCDLDAPHVTAGTWTKLLDEIDEAENTS